MAACMLEVSAGVINKCGCAELLAFAANGDVNNTLDKAALTNAVFNDGRVCENENRTVLPLLFAIFDGFVIE